MISEKKHIYIVLEKNDLDYALQNVTENDLILTDLFCLEHIGETYLADIDDDQESNLVEEVASWFKREGNDGTVFGYVNNFYECSIRPVLKFLSSLDDLITLYGKDNLVFFMPKKLLWNTKTSTYFLAEHESAGLHFYDRYSVFLPYISDFLRSRNCIIIDGGWRIPHQKWLLNFIRAATVFLGRFCLDIKCRRLGKIQRVTNRKDISQVFIIRTAGQASTIIPYLRETKRNTLVMVCHSFVDRKTKGLLEENLASKPNISIECCRGASFSEILSAYSTALFRLAWLKKSNFTYKGVKLNLTHALREVSIMSAGLDLYYRTLLGELQKFNPEKLKILFSLEQKSPHAFVDVRVAEILGIKSAQIKQCNQAFKPLPLPVPANFFLCDTPEIRDLFRSVWPDHTDKVRYVGSFQGINGTSAALIPETRDAGLKICLFTGVFAKLNDRVFKALADVRDVTPFSLTVKLHPRDNNIEEYRRNFSGIDFINESPADFQQFCCQFSLIITYPSGVISDLMYGKTPFIVYVPNEKEYHVNLQQIVPKGIEMILTLEELQKRIFQTKEITSAYQMTHQNFFENCGIITAVDVLEEELDELV